MSDGLTNTTTFWTTEANHKRVEEMGDGPVRPYPFTFVTPLTALSMEDRPIVLHPRARRITVGCNLAITLAKQAANVSRENALSHIEAYRILAACKDWFWLDNKPHPTERDRWAWSANYSRWSDGYNSLSRAMATPQDFTNPHESRMWIAVDGVGEVTTSAGDYLHTAEDILTYLSRTITFGAGDLIALGRAGEALTISPDRRLPEGSMLRAEIDGIGRLEVPILDKRELP